MNLTPKKDFLAKKPLADAHRELVVSAAFREAVHATLLDYVLLLSTNADAAANYYRIEGAREVLQHLLNIAEMPKSLSSPPPANLDHSIR
jgi:hypothetical protein